MLEISKPLFGLDVTLTQTRGQRGTSSSSHVNGDTSSMRVQENCGNLHLATLYLNFLQCTELEDAVQLISLVHGGKQSLHMVQTALPLDGHIIRLLGQKTRGNARKFQHQHEALRHNCPSIMCSGL